MGDLHDFLRRGTGGFDPSPEEGLERTLDRARRRQRRRQVVAGVVSLGLFGATLAGAVLLRDRGGLPVAGPTPTPTPKQKFERIVNDEGTWVCFPGFRNEGRRCLTRLTPVVEVAAGTQEGRPWSLRAFTALYQGPDLERNPQEAQGTQVRRAMLCLRWDLEASRPISICHREIGGDGVVAFDMPIGQMVALMDTAGRPNQPYEGRPLRGIEEAGGSLVGVGVGRWSGMVGWAPPGTERVQVTAGGASIGTAALAGPFGELDTSVVWFVAFAPIDVREITYTAYSADGDVLWSHTHRRPPAEPSQAPATKPTSPTVEVARGLYQGEQWTFEAYTATEGGDEEVCMLLGFEGDEGARLCTPPELEAEVGLTGIGDHRGVAFMGPVPEDTARVEIEQAGVVTEGSVYAAPPELGGRYRFVVVIVPSLEDPVTITAYDPAGLELWRVVKRHPGTGPS